MDKFVELLGSRRFWLLTLAGLAWVFARLEWIPAEVSTPLIAWFTTIAGVGTIDRLRE